VSYYEIGAIGATWKDTTADADMGSGFTGGNLAGAVAFSPNFHSDQVMVAVTANYSSETVHFQIFSFNQKEWNADAGTFTDYPVDLTQDTPANITSLDSASISMSPDYLGSDDALRIAFVALTVNQGSTAEETSSVQRLDDDDNNVLKDEIHFHSVAYDGTNLVVGRYDTSKVYRSADPLGSSPTVSSSAGTKSPGGEKWTVVGWAGTDVVAGTYGNESSFSVSKNDGKTFNDISLIDTALTTLEDVVVSPDEDAVYLVSLNGTDLSVWRYASSWERVLSTIGAGSDFIIRIAPDDPDVVYLAYKGAKTIYYTTDGGEEKWHTRTSRYTIDDLAVEGDGGTAYVLTTSGYVSKSTNSGFTWDSKVSCKLSGGSHMIVSLGEDLLLAGSQDGYVSYSTNGNTSWTKLDDSMGTKVQTIATGLEDGDFVYAVSESTGTGDLYVFRWELGEDDEWGDISTVPSGYASYGLALQEGVLYTVASNGTDSKLGRSIDPTADDPSWSTVDSAGEAFNVAPSALRTSRSEDITKLWAIDSVGPYLFSYKDTLATVVPRMTGPRDGAEIPMNPVSGAAFHMTLTWETPSDKVTQYNLNIALDSDFDEDVLDTTVTKSSGTWDEGDIISAVCGPDAAYDVAFMPDTTYYWKIRVSSTGPVKSGWSEVRSFTIAELTVTPPVILEPAPPAPVISVPPAPSITIEPPEIVLPPQPAPPPEIVIPPAPAAPAPITPAFIWAIVIIGAILVIAVIVLIVRTRRPV